MTSANVAWEFHPGEEPISDAAITCLAKLLLSLNEKSPVRGTGLSESRKRGTNDPTEYYKPAANAAIVHISSP